MYLFGSYQNIFLFCNFGLSLLLIHNSVTALKAEIALSVLLFTSIKAGFYLLTYEGLLKLALLYMKYYSALINLSRVNMYVVKTQ